MSNKLHPAWYQFEAGETPTDLGLVDSLNFFVDHVHDVCLTLQFALDCEHSEMKEETIKSNLWMLQQQAAEAKALVTSWHEAKIPPQFRQVPGGES